jgi:hypothetical protein
LSTPLSGSLLCLHFAPTYDMQFMIYIETLKTTLSTIQFSKFNPHYKSRWTKHPPTCNSISTSWASLQSWYIDGKHVEEFPSVFWGHLLNKNILSRKEDEYYAYSFKSGRDLMLCGPDFSTVESWENHHNPTHLNFRV